MVRSIWDPDLLLRLILKKKQQLGEIEQNLRNLPFDDSARWRLFERRQHLQEGIPELEAKYANLTGERPLGSGDSHSESTPVQGTPPRTVRGRTTRPDEPVGKTGRAASVPSKTGAVSRDSAKKPPEDAQHASADGQNRSSLPITEDYRVISFKGRRYNLPPQRALIVKTLDEARMSGVGELPTKEIQKQAQCGKISQSFRTGDGPKLWKHLVAPVKNCKGMYKLTLPCPPVQ